MTPGVSFLTMTVTCCVSTRTGTTAKRCSETRVSSRFTTISPMTRWKSWNRFTTIATITTMIHYYLSDDTIGKLCYFYYFNNWIKLQVIESKSVYPFVTFEANWLVKSKRNIFLPHLKENFKKNILKNYFPDFALMSHIMPM